MKTNSRPDGTCELISNGNGHLYENNHANFGSWKNKISTAISHQLGIRGWHEANQFEADAPFSTYFEMRKKNQKVTVQFKLTADASNCSPNAPSDYYINCGLSPSDRKYSLKINVSK